MIKKYYEIAGKTICFSGKSEEMYLEERLLAPFRTDKRDVEHQFDFRLTKKIDPPTGEMIYKDPARQYYKDGSKQICIMGPIENSIDNAYLRMEEDGNYTSIQLIQPAQINRIAEKHALSAMGIEQFAIRQEGFILHASYIVWNSKGILFTAPSGTGKSTQADLWNSLRGAQIVNGDRAIVKIKDEKIYACGLPFCGSSGINKNITVPLAAIVCLGQAKETTICRMSIQQSYRKILEGCTMPLWDKAATGKLLELLQCLLQRIPVYELNCTPDESAVIALEQELRKDF